jgi:hypothetical protein
MCSSAASTGRQGRREKGPAATGVAEVADESTPTTGAERTTEERSATGALELLAVGVDVPLTEADLTDGSHDQSHHDRIFFLVGSEAVTVPRYGPVKSPGVAHPA